MFVGVFAPPPQERAATRHTSMMGTEKKPEFVGDAIPSRFPPVNIEPLDDWLHVRPSVDEESAGRLIVPVTVQMNRLERVIILAVGAEVTDLNAGDLVLVLPDHAIELRDGTRIVQREFAIARVRD